MIVVGLDSAPEVTGFAVVRRESGREELRIHGNVAAIRTAADVEGLVGRLAAYRPDVIAIEEAFFSPRFPGAGLVLAELVGRWRQGFESRGHTTVTIPVSSWRRGVLSGLIPARADRAACKAAARRWALASFGVEATEDEADAICLATYVARNATRRAA